ncbi:hypothetical protein DE146DRAFT_649647 [Phaeosphaeria sp. MPI-PUGE-AT-0046c]|nr:hypothetical protein DE146DRAFT_649647 [Phaeosphaeria sp. MPI-PUGE-AT-0046c]
MSLSRISTELDTRIVRYLAGNNAALGALCRTSQYYQSVAEPVLYESVEIKNRVEDCLSRLLLTLIESPRLAGYIKSFMLFHEGDFSKKIALPNVQQVARRLRESQS